METELEKLEKQKEEALFIEFNELDLLREFETESMSMIDYNEPINCKADQELSLVPRGACKYCTLHCDQCSLRCNRFLQYYDRNKLIFSNNRFKVNPRYEQKIKERVISIIISIDNKIKLIESNNGKEE